MLLEGEEVVKEDVAECKLSQIATKVSEPSSDRTEMAIENQTV
jgi:hypothetical protein